MKIDNCNYTHSYSQDYKHTTISIAYHNYPLSVSIFHIIFIKRHTRDNGTVRPKPADILQYLEEGCTCEKYHSSLPNHFRRQYYVIKHSLSICEEISVISLIVFEKRHTIHIGALWIKPTIRVSLSISWENNAKSNNLCRFVKKFRSYLL